MSKRKTESVREVTETPHTTKDPHAASARYLSVETAPEYAFHVQTPQKKLLVDVSINNTTVNCLIDTGSTVTIMALDTYNAMKSPPPLQSSTVPIYTYGSSSPLDVVGSFPATISYKQASVQCVVFVTVHAGDTLLSLNVAQGLGLISVAYNLNSTQDHLPGFLKDYEDCFRGLGKLATFECTLHVDDSVQPSAMPHRRVPYHQRLQVEKELQRLVELDVIERVEQQPTPWVSPITVVQKPHSPSEIRLCIDMRNVNRAIKRERHITPTIYDVITALNGWCCIVVTSPALWIIFHCYFRS